MPFLTKLAGRVFATLRLRPIIDTDDTEESSQPAKGLAGHDHLNLPAPSRPLPIPMISGWTSTHADSTTARPGLDTSPILSDSISSSNDPTRRTTIKSMSLLIH